MPAASATFTPAAAAYAAGDIIEGAKHFANLGDADGDEYFITMSDLIIAHTALISGEAAYRLHMYSATPPSALADNAPWDLPAGDRNSYLGYLDLGTPVDVGASLHVQSAHVNKQITIPGTGIYAYLVTIGAFTATAATRAVRLHSAKV